MGLGSTIGFGGTTGSGAFSGSVFSGAGAGGCGAGVGFGGATGSGAGLGAGTGLGGVVAHPKEKRNAPITMNRDSLMFIDKVFYLRVTFFKRIFRLVDCAILSRLEPLQENFI